MSQNSKRMPPQTSCFAEFDMLPQRSCFAEVTSDFFCVYPIDVYICMCVNMYCTCMCVHVHVDVCTCMLSVYSVRLCALHCFH